MNRKPRILVVGSFVMDLIVSTRRFPQSGETVLGFDYRTATGGKGANQAVQAARLGADVTFVGKVGDDPFGKELAAAARASGVDVRHVSVTSDVSSAIGNVQLELEEGITSNRIIVVPGANMAITSEDVAFLREQVLEYDLVILQLEIPMEINVLVAGYAEARGVPVMLNSAPSAPLPPELLRSLCYISPNEHEAEDITGIPIRTETDIGRALEKLQAMGVDNAMITLGSRGAAYRSKDGRMLCSPALTGLDVKDPTAAGDSFVGAFCTAVTLGLPMEQVLQFANYTAALTVCRIGAQPSLPYLNEVTALMYSHGLPTAAFEALTSNHAKE
ncbi:MAG: ribokinase [Eubacteriales bacterium]|nr:ribokinase [Eubacteriales bacterium]